MSVLYEPVVLVQSNAITMGRPLVEYEVYKVDVRLRELGAFDLVLVRVKSTPSFVLTQFPWGLKLPLTPVP